MTCKNGIYLSIDGNTAVRVIVENSAKVQTDRIKISDELIGELERVHIKLLQYNKKCDII